MAGFPDSRAGGRLRMSMESYDFVVAGSGAGGCAVAARLAAAGAKVLLVEKGGRPVSPRDAMDAISRFYTNGGISAAIGNCLLPIPTGGVLGGTTTINSGTCLRTPPESLKQWERSTVGGFRADSFAGYIEEAWRLLKVKRAPENTMSRSSRLFLNGLASLGIEGGHLLERAEEGCVGSGRCCFICPKGAKLSADRVFLYPLNNNPNIRVETETQLVRISPPRRHGGRVRVGLRAQGEWLPRFVSCRALILACGTLATPYFIRRFKLGPAWRQAGNDLSLHPAAKIFGRFDEPGQSWRGVPQGVGFVEGGKPRLRYEGVYTPPELAAVTMPIEGKELRRWMDRYDCVASFGFLIRDLGRGNVRYPAGVSFPMIRYLMREDDLALMLHGMRFIARVLFAAGAREVLLPLNKRPNVFHSAQALETADFSEIVPADLQMMAFHPLGTCGLGRVVDGDLRLENGLFVCDGSVVPESLGVNPQITIYAFALRLADHLLKQ